MKGRIGMKALTFGNGHTSKVHWPNENIMLHPDPLHIVFACQGFEDWVQSAGISYKFFAKLCGKKVEQSLTKVLSRKAPIFLFNSIF